MSTNRKGSILSVNRRLSLKPVDKALDLDAVLVHELGQFGCFQLQNLLLVAVPIIVSTFMNEYIFTAMSTSYRCAIPECDSDNAVYKPPWILNAIPASGSGLSSCERFEPIEGAGGSDSTCPVSQFNHSSKIRCEEYVHERTNSVVYDFNLQCKEWLRALAGTLSSVGTLLVLPITGYVSDQFGRRSALLISVTNMALLGFIRAFSVNYPMYLTLQLLQTTLGAGLFSSAYVFATELVGPRWRVLVSATCSSMFALGQMVLGSVAWLVQPWRHLIIALHVPCFLIISYYWILSESVRWLLSKGRYSDAKIVLEKVAKVNKKRISDNSMNALLNPPEKRNQEASTGLLTSLRMSPILRRRVCTTPVWWVTATFVYYGLSINSTGLSGNIYLNYILVCAIEIPGFYCAAAALSRIGRRPTLTAGYFLSAACNLAFAFVPRAFTTSRLMLFLAGKFGISVVFTSLYLFTSELYPTEYRHTLLALSSMVGRIGSITAPLTPVLMVYWEGIPSLMFGAMALVSGGLVLTQPETLGTSLPDTLAEAEALGMTSS